MSKWQVKKFRDDFFSPDHTEWVAWPEGGWTECQAFPTHAEAIAYADEEARTREVVLPRDTARPSEHLEIGPMYWGGAVVTTVDDGASLLLNQKEIRPLALALLAHAERMSQ